MNKEAFLQDHYILAKGIIAKSFRSGKLWSEYKLWDSLDYEARMQAIEDSKCGGCGKVRKLTGTIAHLFGTEGACNCCKDENNPRLMEWRREFNQL